MKRSGRTRRRPGTSGSYRLGFTVAVLREERVGGIGEELFHADGPRDQFGALGFAQAAGVQEQVVLRGVVRVGTDESNLQRPADAVTRRGDDLLPSAFRQLELYEAFGWTPPRYMHVPLVIGSDGRRLAKRHGDTRISVLREQGIPPERLLGLLAWSCGWQTDRSPVARDEILRRFDPSQIPRTPFVMTDEMWQELIAH